MTRQRRLIDGTSAPPAKSVRALLLAVIVLVAQPAGSRAVEQGAGPAVSPGRELSPPGGDAPCGPVLPLSRSLAAWRLSPESGSDRLGSTVNLSPIPAHAARYGEEEVEPEGSGSSYWRVLGPVLITVGVGAATWLLFTVRSG